MKQAIVLCISCVITGSYLQAQNWLTTGNSGLSNANFLGTTDAHDLILKVNNTERARLQATNGAWSFGSAGNSATIDSAGKLTFGGSGGYLVGNNKYAFQAAGNSNFGLFFNSGGTQYEFRNGSASPVFQINANNGNGVFNGTLKIGAYTLPATDGTNGQVLQTDGAGVVNWQTVSSGGGGGANTALSNLATTAVNRSLIPGADTINLGSATKQYKDIYLKGGLFWGTKQLLLIGTSNTLSVGFDNLLSNTSSGLENVAFGNGIMQFNTTGNQNTASGYYSLHNNLTGIGNCSFGNNAMFFNSNGSQNAAFGRSAMQNNSSGNANAALGFLSLAGNTTGSYNTAMGSHAGTSALTANSNTYIGNSAGYSNTTGSFNTLVGDSAGYSLTASANTFVGRRSGMNVNSGVYNIYMGYNSGLNGTSGGYNVGVGGFSLQANAVASGNTALGYSTGTLFTNGNYNTFLGYDADASATALTNSTALGNTSRITASNQVRIGNISVTSIGGFVNWTNISDGRFKKNIKTDVAGLAFINKLRPVTYNLDLQSLSASLKENEQKEADGNTMQQDMLAKQAKENMRYSGFVAQEVEKAAKELQYDFSGVDAPKNDKDFYGLRYADFVVPLVKAVQELSKMNDDKDEKMEKQQKQINSLQEQLNDLKKYVLQQGTNSQTTQLPAIVDAAQLAQNVPNPYTSTTTIQYSLPAKYSSAYINFYAVNGIIVKSQRLASHGKGSITVRAADLGAGLIQYALFVDGKLVDSKQMLESK